MGVIATILGAPKVIEKGLELIDDLWETDAEARQSKTNAKIALMKAYAPFKVAQRYLAVMFTGTYLATYILVMVYALMEKPTDHIVVVIEQFSVDWIMLTIVAFYFGGGLAESVGRASKK